MNDPSAMTDEETSVMSYKDQNEIKLRFEALHHVFVELVRYRLVVPVEMPAIFPEFVGYFGNGRQLRLALKIVHVRS